METETQKMDKTTHLKTKLNFSSLILSFLPFFLPANTITNEDGLH